MFMFHLTASYSPTILVRLRLKNKTALITGGDSGIGRAAAIMFAREGARGITITYLSEERPDAEDAKKMIEESGAKVHIVECDLMEESHCKMVVDEHIKQFKTLDIVVNNASKQMSVFDFTLLYPMFRLSLTRLRKQHVREVRGYQSRQRSFDFPVEHPPNVCCHEVRPSSPQAWFIYHQHHIRYRLQGQHRHGRLFFNKGSYRYLHSVTSFAAGPTRYSRECRCSGPRRHSAAASKPACGQRRRYVSTYIFRILGAFNQALSS